MREIVSAGGKKEAVTRSEDLCSVQATAYLIKKISSFMHSRTGVKSMALYVYQNLNPDYYNFVTEFDVRSED